MDCVRADELLQQAAAGALDDGGRAALLAHFDGCKSCAVRRDELRFAELAAVARVPELDLPPELADKLLAIDEPPQSAIELALGGPLRISMPALAFAALVMGLGLLVIAPSIHESGPTVDGRRSSPLAGGNADLLEELSW